MTQSFTIPIESIKIGERFRKEMGDLDGMAKSLSGANGQLQPIGLDPDKNLVFGARRLAAAKKLGWTTISAVTVTGDTLDAEHDENEVRKEMTKPEKTAIRKARIERVKQAAADGKSEREIAKTEGVSRAQVSRDLQTGPPPRATQESANGAAEHKSHSKSVKKCPRCKRKGLDGKDCEDCAKLNREKKGGKKAEEKPAPTSGDSDESVIEDADGVKVPEQARDAFLAAAAMLAWGRKVDELVREAKLLAEGPGGRLIDYESVKIHLKNGKISVVQNRATHVCPMCHGKKDKCECCKGHGWTAAHVHSRLTAEKK